MKKHLIMATIWVYGTLSSIHGHATETNTLKITSEESVDLFTIEAKVEAVKEATISAQTSGRIQSVAFDINDYVEQGSVIVQLRDKQQKAALKQAKAGLTQATAANIDAQSKLEQSTPLFKQGSLSKGQFDTIKANAKSAAAMVKASQAVLEQAKENYSYTQIRAPYSGIVKARLVEVGESVSPGTPLMTGLSLANLRVVADIPQRFTPHLLNKTGFKVTTPSSELTPSKVTFFPYADPNSHSFKVRVDIDGEGSNLFPGMWVKLQVPIGTRQKLMIPVSSLVQKGELTGVYIQTDRGAKLRQIRVGDKNQNRIEVLSGLREGEIVMKNAMAIMADQENSK